MQYQPTQQLVPPPTGWRKKVAEIRSEWRDATTVEKIRYIFDVSGVSFTTIGGLVLPFFIFIISLSMNYSSYGDKKQARTIFNGFVLLTATLMILSGMWWLIEGKGFLDDKTGGDNSGVAPTLAFILFLFGGLLAYAGATWFKTGKNNDDPRENTTDLKVSAGVTGFIVVCVIMGAMSSVGHMKRSRK